MKNKNYTNGLFSMQTLLVTFVLALMMSPLANSKENLAEFEPMDVFELEWATDPRVSPNGKTIVYVRKSNDIMKDRERSNLWQVSLDGTCLLYTSPSPRDRTRSRMPSSA